MYIVGRSRAINQAKGRAAAAAAVEAGPRATQIIGMPVFVWSSVFSSSGPTVSWSTRVEHSPTLSPSTTSCSPMKALLSGSRTTAPSPGRHRT